MSIEETILRNCKTIAVVGLSSNPERHSHNVAHYLKQNGYTIIPVNPMEREVMGEICYPDLMSVPQSVDVVEVFRRSEEVPPIVEQAIKKGVGTVWLQEGVINEPAAERARAAGLQVVMDRCMMKEHRKLGEKTG